MSEGTRKQVVVAILMGIVSAVAFCITSILSELNGTIVECINNLCANYSDSHLLVLFLFIGTCVFYFIWILKFKKRCSLRVICLAIIFSLFTSVYAAMPDVNTIHCPNKLMFLLHFVGYLFCYYVIISIIFYYFDCPCVNYREYHNCISNKKLFYIVALIILLLWLPYVILCFPGNIMYDTGTSIIYFLNISRENVNNPFFQNYLFGFVYKFGVMLGNVNIGIFLYNISQMLLYIVVISYAIVLLKKRNVPSCILTGIIFLYGLLPFFPLYAFNMGKDSNFALCLMVFSILIFELISDNKQFFDNYNKVLLLSESSLLLGLLRNHAHFIVLICLFICVLVQDKKKYKKQLGIIAFAVLVANFIFPRMVQIPKTDISESLSIPLQQTAYYVNRYENEVTADEKVVIDKVIPYETLKLYNPGISDPIKNEFNDSADKESIDNYFKVWGKHFLNHPTAYLKAFYLGSYAYYCPSAERSDLKRHIIAGYALSEMAFKETQLEPNTNPGIDLVKKIDVFVTKLPVIGLFQKIGIYTWIMLLTIVYIISRKKTKYFICICPMLFVFIGDCCSPVNGYFRYAFPMIVCVPVICLAVIFDLKTKQHFTSSVCPGKYRSRSGDKIQKI